MDEHHCIENIKHIWKSPAVRLARRRREGCDRNVSSLVSNEKAMLLADLIDGLDILTQEEI